MSRAKSRLLVWLIAVLLVLVTIALYWPVTGYAFVTFDDWGYVAGNPHVQGGLTWESFCWALTSLDIGLWHPLTWISHMLDCDLFGLSSGWHHLTSLLLHAANTCLLFVVLRRMTGTLWRSAVVSALFALHPLHVESVAWVAERKDVLSTFFLLLTLWAYARYAQGRMQNAECRMHKGDDGGPGSVVCSSLFLSRLPSSIFYLLALFFFALGLMSKPMIVTLPLNLLLLDYWPLRRFGTSTINPRSSTPLRLLMEKLPFAVLALLTALITLLAAKGGGSLPSVAQYPMTARLANATLSYARYFWETFWPGELAVYYPFPPTFSVCSVTGAGLLLAGISSAVFSLGGRRPYLVVGWLWYWVTLLPVIGLIQLATYSHADRYTYVALIGVFVGLTWGAGELVSHWRRPALACAAVAVGAVMLLCLVRARRQVGYWKDSETLYRHALAVTRDNWLVHISLGNTLDRQGQFDDAIRQYQEALRLKPDSTEAHDSLGFTLEKQGRTEEAIQQYQEALRFEPDDAVAHNNLGSAFLGKGQIDEAISHYQEAVRLKPSYAFAHYNLGIALARKGQNYEAMSHYEEALRLRPDHPHAPNDLGHLWTESPNALGAQAGALEGQGRYAEAIRLYQATLKAQPDQEGVLNNLAWLLASCPDAAFRNGPEAVRLATRACGLTGYGKPLFIGTLAAAQAEAGDFQTAIATAERAAALASAMHLEEVAARNRELIQLYRQGQPYHEKQKNATDGHK